MTLFAAAALRIDLYPGDAYSPPICSAGKFLGPLCRQACVLPCLLILPPPLLNPCQSLNLLAAAAFRHFKLLSYLLLPD